MSAIVGRFLISESMPNPSVGSLLCPGSHMFSSTAVGQGHVDIPTHPTTEGETRTSVLVHAVKPVQGISEQRARPKPRFRKTCGDAYVLPTVPPPPPQVSHCTRQPPYVGDARYHTPWTNCQRPNSPRPLGCIHQTIRLPKDLDATIPTRPVSASPCILMHMLTQRI